MLSEFLRMGPRPNTFSYTELKTPTEDFNPANKLGQGGFGIVFKGTLLDGWIVAVITDWIPPNKAPFGYHQINYFFYLLQ
ncbi:probable LRR receptor-like serine/threonine-protein kinase At1g56130 isoform X2 [Magnolia sinica]|uniref:probable LRR receptor-like serine/threonine-protein kinase At1g56130 isoform X2 n=1 Tax=Magnolia sinica TaxID=86752 RepID=UPI0026587BDF|nr:probable LRR receptor-like serine/threonine-protein kinase At1g56130 isoform X2 [Magnolia sinica]